MRRIVALLAAMTLVMALPGVAHAKAPLQATTIHTLAMNAEDGAYVLAWTGTISGDISGTIEWWIDTTTWTAMLNPDSPAQASHYTMKTKVYSGDLLILETLEDGTTTMANQTWRANGVVTYADEELFPGWEGRRVHERGEFYLTVPWTGNSTFRVN